MEIVKHILGKLVDRLPAFIQSRLFPAKRIASQIEIRLMDENSINANLSADAPSLDLYFEITNISYLNLVLDRLLTDFWFGQPTLQGTVLKRYELPSMKTVRNISYKHRLTPTQQRIIEQYCDNPSGREQIYIYLTAYLQSKANMIEVQQTITRSKI
jgi:hypothetical protein